MDKILLIGSGGHACSCIDILEEENQFEIVELIEKYSLTIIIINI